MLSWEPTGRKTTKQANLFYGARSTTDLASNRERIGREANEVISISGRIVLLTSSGSIPLPPWQNYLSSNTVTMIIAIFVSHMALMIVIHVPLFMGSKQVFPGVSAFKRPVSHSPLHSKCRFYIILIDFTFLNLFFLNSKRP